MKKYILAGLCSIFILTLCACGKTKEPIILPNAEDIVSVNIIKNGEDTVSCSDEAWIDGVIGDFSKSEPTGRKSVQDAPMMENYIKLEFQFEDGTSTLFAYEEGGKYYIEQPYQGVYEIKEDTYKQLLEAE